MYIGVIADDFTGATDIAGFLVNNGLPTVQLNGPQTVDLPPGIQAVVVALKSRSCLAREAVDLSNKALAYLQEKGCERFFFKYCSTFDSTDKGNIGPVADALMKKLNVGSTIFCPALPVNKRTVYKGNLFVGDVPINESSMRYHPLNPMTDANLMRVIERQGTGKAGCLTKETIDKGVQVVKAKLKELADSGVAYIVTDTICDADMDVIAEAVRDFPLVTGGSGLGGALARVKAREFALGNVATELGKPLPGGKTILLSGSCSEMTNKQVLAYAQKRPIYKVDVTQCIERSASYVQEIFDRVMAEADGLWPPLISATVPPSELKEIQTRYGVEVSRKAIEAFFAQIAVAFKKAGYDHFITTGGETSSIISQELGVTGFYIGPQIAPGVPWVRTLDGKYSLALKSGNFGAENFFEDALGAIPKV